MNAIVAAFTIVALVGPPTAEAPAPAPAAAAPTPAPTAAPPATAAPAPAPATAAPTARPGWEDEPTPTPAPAPVVVVTPASPPADQAPPPPQKRPKDRAGSAVLGTGIALLSIGGASWFFVAMPAAIAKRVAIDQAEDQWPTDVESRRTYYERARRADDAMEAGFWIGVVGITTGIALTVTGAVMKSRFKRRMAESRVAASPGGLEIRF